MEAIIKRELPLTVATVDRFFSVEMVFSEYGFTSRGQELGSVFGAAMCSMQARKCYIDH